MTGGSGMQPISIAFSKPHCARYVLLLNTDMFFDPDEQCVAKMVRFMDAHPDCGVSGCRLYHPDGTYGFPARRFQTPATIAARRLGLGKFLGKTVDSYLYREKPQETVFDCDWLSGCFLMVRRQAVDAVGLLDLQFRKYFEDVDFCLRMARGGWRVMMNGETFGYHLEQRQPQPVFEGCLRAPAIVRPLAGEMGLRPRAACRPGRRSAAARGVAWTRPSPR